MPRYQFISGRTSEIKKTLQNFCFGKMFLSNLNLICLGLVSVFAELNSVNSFRKNLKNDNDIKL